MDKCLFALPWPAPLVEAALVRRYDRFLADVSLASGETVTAHCVNSGSMEGLVRPGARVWLSPALSPTRKLRWTWSIIEVDGVLVGADTSLPNRLVKSMLEARALHGLCAGTHSRPSTSTRPAAAWTFTSSPAARPTTSRSRTVTSCTPTSARTSPTR